MSGLKIEFTDKEITAWGRHSHTSKDDAENVVYRNAKECPLCPFSDQTQVMIRFNLLIVQFIICGAAPAGMNILK